MLRLAPMVLLLTPACKKATTPADPAFSDAVIFLFASFDSAEADVAFAVRELEDQIRSDMDLDANNPADRALAPSTLAESDIASLDVHTGRNLADALPVAVAARSVHSPDDHARVQMLADQTPVEPYSPDYFDRSFLDGQDCWQDRSCPEMSTVNDLTKENFLMTVDYDFMKDFRWVDLGLPDPSSLEAGQPAVNTGDPRWAFVGRSWTTESFAGRNDNAFIHQSYTIEVWIPDGAGLVRMLCLWSETEFDGISFDDDAVVTTTRNGIDTNFQAVDSWLDEN